MQEHFQQQIEDLKSNLIRMSSLVEAQVELSINALITGNIEQLKGIKHKDKEIDSFDNLLNEQCESILALFHPVASDLRFVLSSIMINNQLERCGDIAVNIAQRVKKTAEQRAIIADSGIIEMASKAKEMLSNSIDAFVNNDRELSNQVLLSDELVDNLNKSVFKFAVRLIKEEPAMSEPGAHLLVLSRHIERLADHATNIAEDVIFNIDGRIVAHSKHQSIHDSEL